MHPWLPLLFFGPFISYAAAVIWLNGRLPAERRRHDDPRPAPNLFDPASSHRWLFVLLEERTAAYHPRIRRAFAVARVSLLLVPVGFVATVLLASILPPPASPEPRHEDAAAVVTIPVAG
jgi:hypothetical protein